MAAHFWRTTGGYVCSLFGPAFGLVCLPGRRAACGRRGIAGESPEKFGVSHHLQKRLAVLFAAEHDLVHNVNSFFIVLAQHLVVYESVDVVKKKKKKIISLQVPFVAIHRPSKVGICGELNCIRRLFKTVYYVVKKTCSFRLILRTNRHKLYHMFK